LSQEKTFSGQVLSGEKQFLICGKWENSRFKGGRKNEGGLSSAGEEQRMGPRYSKTEEECVQKIHETQGT